jgi:hypothetical protein
LGEWNGLYLLDVTTSRKLLPSAFVAESLYADRGFMVWSRAPWGRGSFSDSAYPRLFGEFLDSAIDRLLEGVDLMLPHKLHEFATSVRGTVNMEDVPREFLSISLNDHGKELS